MICDVYLLVGSELCSLISYVRSTLFLFDTFSYMINPSQHYTTSSKTNFRNKTPPSRIDIRESSNDFRGIRYITGTRPQLYSVAVAITLTLAIPDVPLALADTLVVKHSEEEADRAEMGRVTVSIRRKSNGCAPGI